MIRRFAADPADLLAPVIGLCLGLAAILTGCSIWLQANAEAMGAAVTMLAAGAGR